ncbi:hypothetical protein [Epilithonimonas arachidiradicis]|uniref:Uncharacterized protein n=1 Tax=Epilithonimonas arachidiradicis TaxID=1617282 RepID=A0A420CKP7_9FLAO|nr:hypothetical protein [Epilithonimonas arachidiradicis]RKE79067.1 hypothetical protein BXY58_3326 [Epilithonimonas arachidiradicis]GGG59967.1 hypothetical protein GCM10007332_22050 [Epilithonimonas arachidiradicis]
MHPFSITFHTSDNLVFKIISVLLGLFIVGTWAYNSSHIKLVLRIIIGLIGGIAGYYIAIFFFGILELSYTTIKDDFSSNKQSATIIGYEKFISTSNSRNRRNIGSTKRQNTFYKPLLEYKDQKGITKNSFGDVSFSDNNKKPVGEKIDIIAADGEVRMITPIKTFTFIVNIVTICFIIIFYYILYSYAKTQSLENIGNFVLVIFGYVIFPIAFCVLIYLFLNIGYDYFFLGKRYTGRNTAIGVSALGIFLLLCLFGFIKSMLTKKRKKKKKISKLNKNH